VPWHKNSEEAKAVFAVWLDKPNYKDDWVYESCVHLLKQQSKFDKWLRSDDSVIVANCQIILIRRTMKMLSGQLQSQVEPFEQQGGFREQLTQIRTAAKAKNENTPACPNCGKPMTIRKATTGKNAGKRILGLYRLSGMYDD
jgi:four helix bundle suffix protein